MVNSVNGPDLLSGLLVSTALPFRADRNAPGGLGLDLDRYAAHCRWLLDRGCRGIAPNGSLGEYESLTDAERRAVARTAIEATGHGQVVAVGVSAPGSHQARRWAELAAEDGADAVLCLPPTAYRANRSEVIHHYREVAGAGIPVVIDNDPVETRVDLTPDLLAELARIDNVIAVKESSGDVRRVLAIRDQAPGLAVLAGADDLAYEALLIGAAGWFSGFANAFPDASVRLVRAVRQGSLAEARAVYQALLSVLRWDARVESVQAIKFVMDCLDRSGGPCRSPRGPLSPASLDRLEADVRGVAERLRGHRFGASADSDSAAPGAA